MTQRLLILLPILVIAGWASAQTDFRPGYVIVKPADTLFGSIDYRGEQSLKESCRFRAAGEEQAVREYTPEEILAFRFATGKYYVSKEVKGKRIFLEYLIKGKVNVYSLRDDMGEKYFMDKEGGEITEIPYEEGIRYAGDERVFYKSNRHIGILLYYTQDAPELQPKIKRMSRPTHHRLVGLAEEYHNAVCKGEQCVIYEKRQPVIKVNLEALAGVVNFNDVWELKDRHAVLSDRYYFQGGIMAHVWFPGASEKLFFKTGFLYSGYETVKGDKTMDIQFPVHIAYFAPHTFRVRPSVSVGLFSPHYSAGVAVKLAKGINAGLQGWARFNYKHIPWIPYSLASYSLLGNVYIEF